ncbi:single-strand DNA-binding protein [Propionispira arboris]|jgi:single-strand DNA-binding protein|uniref:Single-stranded DNA-binding protein n=1 Tax=Propionispira arboris TaxID=84035 RepID=A0A1H7BB06_9FIRM|nr:MULTISPECIES: single-stranded DNA-binding protein [Propionispira]SEJ74094.1 single-strand DNA-binding protein [Propionispira arboris]
MNKVIIVGRLTRDPEVRYTQSGKAVASFTVAVNRRFSRSDQQNTADFIPVVAWEKLAEICGNNLIKGSQVLVEGRLQVRNYDAQDGSKRYVTEIVAQEIEFMGGKPTRGPEDQAGAAPATGGADSFGSQVFPDEEIPF